jgi:hypothetical protein
MLGVEGVGDRRSQAILVRNFSMENWERQEERKRSKERRKKEGRKKKEEGRREMKISYTPIVIFDCSHTVWST